MPKINIAEGAIEIKSIVTYFNLIGDERIAGTQPVCFIRKIRKAVGEISHFPLLAQHALLQILFEIINRANSTAFSRDLIVIPLPISVSTICKSDKTQTARRAVSAETPYWLANADLAYIFSPTR